MKKPNISEQTNKVIGVNNNIDFKLLAPSPTGINSTSTPSVAELIL